MIGNNFTKFTATTDYSSFVSSTAFTRPNVSWTTDTDKVYYNPHLEPSIKICVMKSGVGYEVSQYDFDNHYDEIVSQGYTVEGIVVVPQSHMKDGKARIMSLKAMSCTSPSSGSLANEGICWGGYGVDTSLKNYTQVVKVTNEEETTSEGSMDYCYLPSDKFSSDRQCVTDRKAYYHPTIDSNRYAPSPYLTYDRRSTVYPTTAMTNALSDFDGSGNTSLLCSMATGQADWRTDATITNESGATYYPAACCCARYGTTALPSGNWYLPACGELGYIMPRFIEINNAISLINSKAANSAVLLGTSTYYWSSSEYSSINARGVHTYNGPVDAYAKNNNFYVRAFAALPLSSLSF